MFDPQVGDKVNWILYSDVEPATVISRTPKSVTVRIDKATITKPPVMIPGGFAAVIAEHPEYNIEEDPDGRIKQFRLRKNGRWLAKGANPKSRGDELRPGWHKFHDYSF